MLPSQNIMIRYIGRHLRLIVIVLVAKKSQDEYCDPFFGVTQNKTKQSTNILFVFVFQESNFLRKGPLPEKNKMKKTWIPSSKTTIVFYTLDHFLVDYPKWYNISLDTTPALHFHNNARLLTPFLCTWYDLWPFLTLHWRNVSTTEKCIIIVHIERRHPPSCAPTLNPLLFIFLIPLRFS